MFHDPVRGARLGVMALTALCLTFIVFYLTNLPPIWKSWRNPKPRSACPMPMCSWLEQARLCSPVLVRYGEWLGVMPGWTRTVDGVTTGRCIKSADDG
jgi:peptide/nickel transport system permease protein